MMENQIGKDKIINTGLKRFLFLLLAFFLFIAIDRSSIVLADINFAGSFGYTWLMVHHSIQILLALAIMALPFWHRSILDWGLNFRNHSTTFSIIGKFTVGWMIGTTLFTLVTQWMSGWPPLLGFDLNLENVLIYLVFESLIVGISEELVFRGLLFGILAPYFTKKIKLFNLSFSMAGVISALIFAFAHIGFQLSPLTITSFAPMQIFVAFILGIFYGFVREQTGSLLGPILAHNISDGWLSVLYIIIQMVTQG